MLVPPRRLLQNVTSVNTTAGTVAAGLPGAVIAIMFRYTPENLDNPWLQPLLDGTPTNLLFSQYVTARAGSNQYAAKNNSVEAEAPGPLNVGQLVSQANPSGFFT